MSDRVMVFAPAPQLTVTIERPSEKPELHVHPGGQGIWEARMIRALGVDVSLVAALGGEVGAVLEPLVAAEGVTLRAVRRESGSGWYVHDRREGAREEIASEPGAALSRHELDELHSLALAEGMRAGVAVLSGPAEASVVPDDAYRRLAADLRETGCRVVADLSGGHLEGVLTAGVHFVKVSHEELTRDGRATGESVEELTEALRRLRADGAEAVLVSRAAEPALALLGDDVFEVSAPRLETADHRGAGDSMTAAVAAVLAGGGELTEAVRTGAAAGALNVTRHGLGTGRADAIHELRELVRLNRLISVK